MNLFPNTHTPTYKGPKLCLIDKQHAIKTNGRRWEEIIPQEAECQDVGQGTWDYLSCLCLLEFQAFRDEYQRGQCKETDTAPRPFCDSVSHR